MSKDKRMASRARASSKSQIQNVVVAVVGSALTVGVLVPLLLTSGSEGGMASVELGAESSVELQTESITSDPTEPSERARSGGVGQELDPASLVNEELAEVLVPATEVADLLGATNPAAAALRRNRANGEIAPSGDEIRAALALLESELAAKGLNGQVTFWPGWGFSYSGTAPGFTTWVSVDVYPSVDGTLEFIARREQASYALIEEDLSADAPVGKVWLGEKVAYGHNSAQNPDEWVAVDVGSELYFVRVVHEGAGDQLIGRESFMESAARAIQVLRTSGFARETLGSSAAFGDDASLGAKMLVALTTSCDGDFCGPIRRR